MEERKDIDRLFQEKFKDFDKSPSPEMWTRIEQELNKDKKKRRVVPIWWRLGGAAALLLLFFSIAITMFDSTSDLPIEQPFVDSTEEVLTDEPNKTPDSIDKINGSASDAVAEEDRNKVFPTDGEAGTSIQETTNTSATNGTELANADEVSVPSSRSTDPSIEQSRVLEADESKKNYYALNNTPSLEPEGYSSLNYAITANGMPNQHIIEKEKEDQSQTIEEAIAAAEALKETPIEEESIKERWSVSPVVAPVYSMALGEGSTIHGQFSQNSKSSDVTMSYGVGGSYAVTRRLKVRAGVNRVDFTNNTNDVIAFTAVDVANRPNLPGMANIAMDENANVLLMSASSLNRSAIPEALNAQPVGQLILDYGFLEIPLAIEYRLVDQKFGMNVIGGFSTFFLNNNQISADFNGETTIIGEANNINSTSYSANFGIGFDYGLSKQINVMLEPTIKYQFNTFNNTFGDVQPMFIGIYTGLSFKF